MKNYRWSEYLECASLVGVGVGTLATVLSKQVLYTSAPLSIAVLMSYMNRRRFEALTEHRTSSAFSELDQRLTKHVELLGQQVAELPTPEMVGSLRNSILRHTRDKLDEVLVQVEEMQQETLRQVAQLEKQTIAPVQQEVLHLQDQYAEIHAGLTSLHGTVHQLSMSGRVDDAEEAIAQLQSEASSLKASLQGLAEHLKPALSDLDTRISHLGRQFRNLPPPIDPTSIREELGELTRMMADLVPKRDLNALLDEIRTLKQQQTTQAETGDYLQSEVQTLLRQLQALPDLPQFRAQIEATLTQELHLFNEQLQTLPDVRQLHLQLEETLRREMQVINAQLQALQDIPDYEFVFDLKSLPAEMPENGAIAGSRRVFEDALDQTQERLILIWPWANHCELDDALIARIEQFLSRGGQLDLGWCQTTYPQNERFLSIICRQWRIDPLRQAELQTTLQTFLKLKRNHPRRFRFKVLGTVENFLVSDRSMAVLGIENALSTATLFQEVELKLRTTNPEVIQKLVHRFEHPSLNQDDIRSYWNRALTRYELGDRVGAIADLNCFLAVNSEDADAYNLRGVIRYDRGNKTEAIQDFSDAIDLNPFQVAAYCNRGFVQADLGDHHAAIADYNLATQVQPDSAIAHFYRGSACQSLGDYQGAIADYTQAIWYASDAAIAYYYRAMAYRHLADYDTAMPDFETAAHLFEEQGSRVNAQRSLTALQRTQQEALEEEQLARAIDTDFSKEIERFQRDEAGALDGPTVVPGDADAMPFSQLPTDDTGADTVDDEPTLDLSDADQRWPSGSDETETPPTPDAADDDYLQDRNQTLADFFAYVGDGGAMSDLATDHRLASAPMPDYPPDIDSTDIDSTDFDALAAAFAQESMETDHPHGESYDETDSLPADTIQDFAFIGDAQDLYMDLFSSPHPSQNGNGVEHFQG